MAATLERERPVVRLNRIQRKFKKKKREKKKKRTHDISMKRSTFKFLCFEIHTSLSYLRVLLVGIQKKKKEEQ